MLSEDHLTSIPGCLAQGEWSHHHSYLGHEHLFCIVLCILYTSSFFFFFNFIFKLYITVLVLPNIKMNPDAYVMSILFLSFIVPIFAWNIPLVSLIYLKRSLVFPILFFLLFLCFDHWGRLSYLSLLFFEIWVYLCIQMGNPLTNRLKGLDLIDKCLKNYG